MRAKSFYKECGSPFDSHDEFLIGVRLNTIVVPKTLGRYFVSCQKATGEYVSGCVNSHEEVAAIALYEYIEHIKVIPGMYTPEFLQTIDFRKVPPVDLYEVHMQGILRDEIYPKMVVRNGKYPVL